MALLQNTKPKITMPNILKVKKIQPQFEFLEKAKFNILDGHEQKISKL